MVSDAYREVAELTGMDEDAVPLALPLQSTSWLDKGTMPPAPVSSGMEQCSTVRYNK